MKEKGSTIGVIGACLVMDDIECPGGHPDRGGDDAAATLAITTLVLYVTFPIQYSNTLLVSLNNRIYLRDYPSPEYEGSASPPVPDGAHATTVTTLRFAIPEPQPRRALSVIFPRSTIPRPVDLDNGRGNDTSTNWSLVGPFSCNCYPIPTFLNGPVPLSSPTFRNVIGSKIPSGWWALATQRTGRMHFDDVAVAMRVRLGLSYFWGDPPLSL
ncbi:hypothetical protein EDB83DRAFT_2548801 [Lactarius deliciosus]|nr:hypothetical protein EDB83DRAFT_2548801 [Lactarius deliciosus]